jgi:ubiquitin C-terminal hydrolase
MTTHEHIDVAMTSKQSFSPALVLQFIVMLGALGAVYANSVANDREHDAKFAAQQKQIDQLQEDSRTFKSDLRSDLKDIKDELREMRNEMNKRPSK